MPWTDCSKSLLHNLLFFNALSGSRCHHYLSICQMQKCRGPPRLFAFIPPRHSQPSCPIDPCLSHLRVSIFTSSTSVQATSIFHPDGGSLFPFSPFHTATRITISNHKMSGVNPTEWQSVLQLLVFVSAPTHPLGLRLNATSLNHFFPDDFHSILYLIFIMSIRIMMYQIFCVTIYLISALPGKLGSIEGEGSV